jgi:hypothetical protein
MWIIASDFNNPIGRDKEKTVDVTLLPAAIERLLESVRFLILVDRNTQSTIDISSMSGIWGLSLEMVIWR